MRPPSHAFDFWMSVIDSRLLPAMDDEGLTEGQAGREGHAFPGTRREGREGISGGGRKRGREERREGMKEGGREVGKEKREERDGEKTGNLTVIFWSSLAIVP